MRRIEDFKFRVSHSNEGYTDKEQCKMCLSAAGAKSIGREKMAFKEESLSLTEFLEYATSGYSFCGLFGFEDREYWVESNGKKHKEYPYYKRGKNKGCFKISFKSDQYFVGSQVIFVDIDYTEYETIEEYVDVLRYKPSCVYLSFSDGKEKDGVISRRFRLVYVFDEVLSYYEFKSVSDELYKDIIIDTGEEMSDNCGKSVSQYMNGGSSSYNYRSDLIYSKSDFSSTVQVPYNEVYYIDDVEIEPVVFDEEMIYDMTHFSYEFVVRKWFSKGLRYFWKSEVEFSDYYAMTTEDYCSLYYSREKVEDGNMRRRKLYVRASLRCLMKEDVTADELLYNLYIDREKFFDNSDGVLSIEALMERVVNALNTDKEDIKVFLYNYKRPKFVINPECHDKRSLVSKARKDITDKTIGEVYDDSKSVKENFKSMKESGIKISLPRLYNWCKENNINLKPNTFKAEYNPSLSIRENMKLMGCTKYQVEKIIKGRAGKD